MYICSWIRSVFVIVLVPEVMTVVFVHILVIEGSVLINITGGNTLASDATGLDSTR